MTAADLEALVQAIIDQPEDDQVRLVFADALEEQGDGERAEFIRVQVKLANFVPEGGEPYHPQTQTALWEKYVQQFDPRRWRRWDELRRRERELLINRAPYWFLSGWETILSPNWHKFTNGQSRAVEWDRGFVARVFCPCAAWVADNGAVAGAVCGAQPVERVVIGDREPGENFGEPEYRWWWRDKKNLLEAAWHVPAPLFDLLAGDKERTPHCCFYYRSDPAEARQDALNALFAAGLEYGRQQARRRRG